jgi:hypothetical protein
MRAKALFGSLVVLTATMAFANAVSTTSDISRGDGSSANLQIEAQPLVQPLDREDALLSRPFIGETQALEWNGQLVRDELADLDPFAGFRAFDESRGESGVGVRAPNRVVIAIETLDGIVELLHVEDLTVR